MNNNWGEITRTYKIDDITVVEYLWPKDRIISFDLSNNRNCFIPPLKYKDSMGDLLSEAIEAFKENEKVSSGIACVVKIKDHPDHIGIAVFREEDDPIVCENFYCK